MVLASFPVQVALVRHEAVSEGIDLWLVLSPWEEIHDSALWD